MAERLLGIDEPAPYSLTREQGPAPFFLICDHAGARIPQALGDLGVSAVERGRHIAWDIGAAGVAHVLSEQLDACLIQQTYSRLVIDCNRPTDSSTSIVTVSEKTPIPGNLNLSPADAARRVSEIFRPYHERIEALLDARDARRQPTVLVSVHSFTPVYLGVARPWHAGVLYNRDSRLSLALRTALQREAHLVIGDNEPYSVSDASDYAIPRYGEQRGNLHVEIEVRQDLIAHTDGQREWGKRLATALTDALAVVRG